MAFRIGGDADFKIGDALQPVNKVGGVCVTIFRRLEFIRALGRIAPQRHHVAHADIPVAPGRVIDFAAAVADAGQMRRRNKIGIAQDASDGIESAFARAAAGAISDGDEFGFERRQADNRAP